MDIQLVNHNKKMTDTIDNRGEFVKAGYLIKSPPLSRAPVAQWHRRWFLLMDSALVFPMAKRYVRLDYYQSEADAKRLADPKGTVLYYYSCYRYSRIPCCMYNSNQEEG